MNKNSKSVLIFSILGLLVLLLGCTKNESSAPPTNDSTTDVFSKVSTHIFQMDTSQFQLLSQDKFKFAYDTDITLNGNQRAKCMVEIFGSSKFLTSANQLAAQLELDKVNTISSNASLDICVRYAKALEIKKFFELPVFDLSENFISFASLDFSVRDADPEKDFLAETHHTRVSDFGIRRSNRLREYFVRPNTTVDVTASVFQGLNGTYNLVNDNGTDLKLNFSETTISFSSTPCGFSYVFNNKGAYVQALGIGLWSVLEYAKAQPSTQLVSSECGRWETNIQNLPLAKLEWGALVNSGLQKAILMRFPSSNAGRDRAEIFE